MGYIASRFAVIELIHHDNVFSEEPFIANSYAGYELAGGILIFIFLIRWLKKLDSKRFEITLHYEIDEQFKTIYDQFGLRFGSLISLARIWQYANARPTNKYKRTAGAGKLINRVGLKAISANKGPLPYFSTNVLILCLSLNNMEFYFLPERMLVKQSEKFAAVFYKIFE